MRVSTEPQGFWLQSLQPGRGSLWNCVHAGCNHQLQFCYTAGLAILPSCSFVRAILIGSAHGSRDVPAATAIPPDWTLPRSIGNST